LRISEAVFKAVYKNGRASYLTQVFIGLFQYVGGEQVKLVFMEGYLATMGSQAQRLLSRVSLARLSIRIFLAFCAFWVCAFYKIAIFI